MYITKQACDETYLFFTLDCISLTAYPTGMIDNMLIILQYCCSKQRGVVAYSKMKVILRRNQNGQQGNIALLHAEDMK